MRIYKIFRGPEWADLCNAGQTAGAAVDIADGYIHFSTAEQVAETARWHFAGQAGLILAAVEADSLGPALIWERSRGGALFPHLYGPLRRADVIWHRPLTLVAGQHRFPEDL